MIVMIVNIIRNIYIISGLLEYKILLYCGCKKDVISDVDRRE